MERIKYLFFLNDNKPLKERFIDRSESKIFMFLSFFFVLLLPIAAIFHKVVGVGMPLFDAFIVVIGAWVLNTVWMLVSNRGETQKARFFVNIFFCLGSIPILGSFLYTPPYYSLPILIVALLWLGILTVIRDSMQTYWDTLIKMRWFFLGLMILCYGTVIYYETGYRDLPPTIVKPIIYALEFYVVSCFTMLQLVYLKKDIAGFYDEKKITECYNCGNVSDIWDQPGGKFYVLKSVVGIVINFMMLLIVCIKIGLYILIHYIW